MNRTAVLDHPAPAQLLADPRQLAEAWERLKASHHHLHAPEAARLLGVPEAALVASRLGQGALRLPADPALILASAHQWRRVLVALGTALGVHLSLDPVRLALGEGAALSLVGPHLETVFDASRVAHVFWFVEVDDSHGRTRSLQMFDAAGEAVIKLFIFHKTAAAAAEKTFQALAAGIEQTPFQPAAASASAIAGLPSPARPAPALRQALPGPAPQAFRQLFAALDGSQGPLSVTLEAGHARQRHTGPITHARTDAAMVHLHEQDIRAHLRVGAVTSAVAELDASGAVRSLVFGAVDGSQLRLEPADPDAATAFRTFAGWAMTDGGAA